MNAANELPNTEGEGPDVKYEWEEWKRRFPWAIPAPSFDHAGRVIFGHIGSPTFPTEPCFCEHPEPKRPRSKGYRRGAK